MMFGRVPARGARPGFELGPAALEVDGLTVTDHPLTVADLNLTVRSGEVFGLAGLEGSGQRHLLKACAGLLRPDRGHIRLAGRDITHRSYHQRQNGGIAYLAAGRLEEGLVAGLSLTEHLVLAEPEHDFFVDWDRARDGMAGRIEQYEIVGQPETTADQLSGGNQQRLLFSLLNSRLLLLLLEHPTRGLDVRSANTIWELLYARRAEGTAIMFLSADLDEIIERSDRIAVFSGGKMSRVVTAADTSVDALGYMIGGQL
jgi:simple sugar transport system ATP-binding protein